MALRPLYLAAALRDPGARPDPARWAARIRAAERTGLDFVTVEAGPADPLIVAARLAAQTSRIGILPAISPTTSEPFHVSTALATIDTVSGGRAGWLASVTPADEAGGLVTWEVPADVHAEAAEHLDAVRRLWDSWEDGAEIRDGASARFIDRDRVHHVDVQGEHLAVRGPSITPRPPQGQPVIAVQADDAAGRELAALRADVLVTREAGAPPTPGLVRILEVSVPASGSGARGDLDRFADELLAHHAAGFDGVLLHADDLDGTLAALVPALEARGAPRAAPVAGDTLRARLGLPPAVNRYATTAR